MRTDRRGFLGMAGAAGLATMLPRRASSVPLERVLVVGGGFAGATVAKYLRHWGGGALDVTLVDPKAKHTSCVMSNLVLTRQLGLNSLRFSFDALAAHGVQVIRDKVLNIDPDGLTVDLRSRGVQGYDRIILAPGIAFYRVPGLDTGLIPHAWIAGSTTNRLRRQLKELVPGSTVVMTIPETPYRCPPGPYERACLLADMVRRAGGGSVVVLDANDGIQAERETFSRAFESLYGDIIDYRTEVQVEAVDSPARVLITNQGEFQGDIVNVIPKQRAAGFVRRAGLTRGGRWAPVDPVTYESTEAPGVYVLGDSQGTGQPKSAHMANAQAKVCADAIIRQAQGLPTHGAERLANITTNSACYSPINRFEASWLTANFAYDVEAGSMKLTHIGEAEDWDRENHAQMFDWASNLFADTFG